MLRGVSVVVLRRQRGAALLVMILFLVLGGSYALLRGLNKASSQAYRDEQTAKVLAEAKAALIGMSIVENDKSPRPGSLPSPDLNNNGQVDVPDEVNVCGAQANRGNSSCIGRLPWKTLGLPDLRDSAGERLWYAMSPNFRDANGVVINSNSSGTLSVDTLNNIIAIIFAPGSALDNQSRDGSANENNPANYLEAVNSSGGVNFTSQIANDQFNDHLVTITVQDLFPTVERRILGEAKIILSDFFKNNNFYPYPATFGYPTQDKTCMDKTYGGALPQPTCTCTNNDSKNPGMLACSCVAAAKISASNQLIAKTSGYCTIGSVNKNDCHCQNNNGSCFIPLPATITISTSKVTRNTDPCAVQSVTQICTQGSGNCALFSYPPQSIILPNWFIDNKWDTLVYYAIADACTKNLSATATGCGNGNFLIAGNISNIQALVISPDWPLVGQNRPSQNIKDNFENINVKSIPNKNGNDVYEAEYEALTSNYNDQVLIVAPKQ